MVLDIIANSLTTLLIIYLFYHLFSNDITLEYKFICWVNKILGFNKKH